MKFYNLGDKTFETYFNLVTSKNVKKKWKAARVKISPNSTGDVLDGRGVGQKFGPSQIP